MGMGMRIADEGGAVGTFETEVPRTPSSVIGETGDISAGGDSHPLPLPLPFALPPLPRLRPLPFPEGHAVKGCPATPQVVHA